MNAARVRAEEAGLQAVLVERLAKELIERASQCCRLLGAA
jgi:hypothetical protein